MRVFYLAGRSRNMQLLATKALAAGFAVSMAIGGNATPQMFMLHSFSEGAPNTTLPAGRQALSPATTYHQNSPVIVFSAIRLGKTECEHS